jgi:hypothetical protein
MPQYERELLSRRWNGRYREFLELLNARLAIKGIDLETGTYIKDSEKKNKIKEYKKTIHIYEQNYMVALQNAKEGEQTYLQSMYESEKKSIEGRVLKRFEEKANDEKYRGYNFSTFATDGQFEDLYQIREQFVKHEVNYQLNQTVLDNLYQKLHCTLDVIGEIMLDSSVAIQMKMNHSQERELDKHFLNYIGNSIEQKLSDAKRINASIEAIKGLINYILDDNCELTSAVMEAAKEEGIRNVVKMIQMVRISERNKETV